MSSFLSQYVRKMANAFRKNVADLWRFAREVREGKFRGSGGHSPTLPSAMADYFEQSLQNVRFQSLFFVFFLLFFYVFKRQIQEKKRRKRKRENE